MRSFPKKCEALDAVHSHRASSGHCDNRNPCSNAAACSKNKETPSNDRKYSTYGLNTLFGGYSGAGGKDHCRFSQLTRPSVTPLSGDKQGTTGGTLLYSGDLTNATRAPHIFRHGDGLGSMNVLYCDGHAKTIPYLSAKGGNAPLTSYDTWRPRY